MKEQLYKVVPLGQPLEKSDLSFILGEKRLTSAEEAMVVGCESNGLWIRPVSTETATGSEEEIEEDFGGGARSMHADLHEMQRMRSLREQYAGLAMQGYTTLVTPENVKLHQEKGPKMPIEDYMALLSVQMADALIAALNKKEEAV